MSSPPADKNGGKRRRFARILDHNTREMIYNSYVWLEGKHYTGKRAQNVADMLGVSKASVERVVKDYKGANVLGVPPPPPPDDGHKKKPTYNQLHLRFLENCLTDMLCEDKLKELPTVQYIHEFCKSKAMEHATIHHIGIDKVFPFSETTVWRMLQKLGYTFKVDEDDRDRLKQQEHIVNLRRKYIQNINDLRNEGYLLFYLDETWVNKNTTRRKTWVKTGEGQGPARLTPGQRKKPIGKGGRAIVIGIGSRETGVVPELFEVFRGKKSKTENDYHKEMNAPFFENWIKKVAQYINAKFPGRKVAVVMDNASYHSRVKDECKVPLTSWNKKQISEWYIKRQIVPPCLLPGYLTQQQVQARLEECLRHDIPYDYTPPKFHPPMAIPSLETYMSMTKKDMLFFAPSPKEKKYVVDEYLKSKNITTIRLPPYHCEYNPIELVWARGKGAVAKKNVTYELARAMQIMDEECKKCDDKYWKSLEEHAMKQEEKSKEGDGLLHILNMQDTQHESIQITLNDSSSENDSENEHNFT